ncbi:MAG TPA: Kdo hydroxylase family protein [Nevskiaceae bacterium]|nr:Kdo hydroxylase family protein [Nevskiaceae bacterium]
MIFAVTHSSWTAAVEPAEAARLTAQLEQGGVLRFAALPFAVNDAERALFDPKILSGARKNISYDLARDRLAGAADDAVTPLLHGMLKRYATQAQALVHALFPHYRGALQPGRSSFRPAEIAGRASSVKKDDTRLHVDAFPATPLQGRRILRVFTNVNPDGKTRHWRVGEPFAQVAERFAQPVDALPGIARRLLRAARITKSYRTAYDDLMLKTHDAMKMDDAYQDSVPREDVHFAPGETWVVYSDQVSHAALAGQHLMEQTFYLPADKMLDPDQSPLRVLERLKGRALLV